MSKFQHILEENRRRNLALAVSYDPVRGIGCYGERVQVGDSLVPKALLDQVPQFPSLGHLEQQRARIRHDFEFWAATCATIQDKITAHNIPFVLNRPQRRLLAVMEDQRLAGQPIRVILLKARQWGGSTLVQLYMAWIQIVHHHKWNSFICGHLHMTSLSIKRMYTLLLRNYPREMLDQPRALHLKKLDGCQKVFHIEGIDCLVILGTAHSEDAVRGYNLAMAHLSEVAFWPDTAMHSPEDVVRSVQGAIVMEPGTVVVMESSANGVGQFFHTEWLRAKGGQGDKTPVFVPWYEIEIYSLPVKDTQQLWESLDDYERQLWDMGCTLEQINWYHNKRREYASHHMMMAEFPTNDIEAFANTGRNVFDRNQLEALRVSCCLTPKSGDIEADYKSVRNVHFVQQEKGPMKIWRQPDANAGKNRYLVVTDVGGRSAKSDFSVIAVWDTKGIADKPEVVAQWRGLIDHDLLAWKAAQIATLYRHALLVIESNTLETEGTEGNAGQYILNEIEQHYGNLYVRNADTNHPKPGFQTNRENKRQMIYNLIRCVRDNAYIEHDQEAINEMQTYELTINGKFAAMKGHHDDILMTRAIALLIINKPQRTVKPITQNDIHTLAHNHL